MSKRSNAERPDHPGWRTRRTRRTWSAARLSFRGRPQVGRGVPPGAGSLGATEVAGELQFIGAIRDQTERHRMRAMLVQSERLASIGLLSAGVAHEINNPLAFIANNLAVLERDLAGVLDLVAAYETDRELLIAEQAPEICSGSRPSRTISTGRTSARTSAG